MVLYRYFALGSVLTRVSTLNEKEPEEAKTIVYGGCSPVPADRMNIVRELKIRQIYVHAVEANSPNLIPTKFSSYTVHLNDPPKSVLASSHTPCNNIILARTYTWHENNQ